MGVLRGYGWILPQAEGGKKIPDHRFGLRLGAPDRPQQPVLPSSSSPFAGCHASDFTNPHRTGVYGACRCAFIRTTELDAGE